jgi:hypothetical protein
MMDVRAFSTASIRSYLKQFFYFGLLALASISPTEAEVGGAQSVRRDRQILGFFFTASSRQAAFPVAASGGGGVELIVVDLETGTPKRLTSRGAKLLSPSFSSDGERLLVVRLRNDTAEYELLSCATVEYVCRRWLSTKDSINSPTEVSADKIVYVSSPRKQIAGVRSQYLQHDLWMLEKDRPPRQLTDVQFGEMNWLSATSSSIYFSAIGPRRGKEIIPKFAPLASVDSDIFKLSFAVGEARIELPKDQLTPLFLARGRSTAASIARDQSVAAFLRTESRRGGYRYDLVVVDLKTQRENLIESTGLGFSRPAVVDQTIVAREIFDDRYVISRLRLGDSFAEPIAELTDASIAVAGLTEIRIETEGR